MKKKRSTKSKELQNRRISKAIGRFFLNIIFLLICLSGAAFCGWKFYECLNSSLDKMNEKPIATISFKRKTAQRKFLERMVWDRLKQDSPVYDGDTIRTAPESEATIYFTDGNIMELSENSMAQIFLREGIAEASLEEGNIVVNSSKAENGAVIATPKSRITIKAGSSVSAKSVPQKIDGEIVSESEPDIHVQVIEGEASVALPDVQEEQLIDAGHTLVMDNTGEEKKIPVITVTSPRPNEKILNFNSSPRRVKFVWSAENLSGSDYLVLETSRHKNFDELVEQIYLNDLTEFTVDMPNGSNYWRIYPASTGPDYSAESKVSVLDAPVPELIAPEKNFNYVFRAKLPAIRFIWSQNEWITAFDFEIADNPEMKNPVIKQRTSMPSSIVSSLDAGTYYWRVTPYYTVNNYGFAEPSPVSSFRITRQGDLQVPELLLPLADASHDTKEKNVISFSWKKNPEVITYNIKIARDKNLYDTVVNTNVSSNYFQLDTAECGMTTGTWYWGVTARDVEANISDVSEIRTFKTLQGEVIHRAVYPPDNFTTPAARIGDIRFTWKTNVKGETRFQVAKDKEFREMVLDQAEENGSVTNLDITNGKYFWRVLSFNEKENTKIATEPRVIRVMAPLDAPVQNYPNEENYIAVRNNSSTEFNWEKVTGADYYLIKVYRGDRPSEILFEDSSVRGSRRAVNLEKFDDGEYEWSCQAVQAETEFSTRRVSQTSTKKFAVKQIRNVKLEYPANGATVDGIAAISNPGILKWTSEQRVEKAVITLSKNPDGYSEPILSMTNPGKEVRLPRLEPGRYYWTIRATNEDGLDISATKPNGFTVSTYDILSRPLLSIPTNNMIFGPTQIRASRKIQFRWSQVTFATEYNFVLKNSSGKIIRNVTLKGTDYTLEDMAELGSGKFLWTVEGLQKLPDGTLVRRGMISTYNFSIELPVIQDFKLNEAGVMYGM